MDNWLYGDPIDDLVEQMMYLTRNGQEVRISRNENDDWRIEVRKGHRIVAIMNTLMFRTGIAATFTQVRKEET